MYHTCYYCCMNRDINAPPRSLAQHAALRIITQPCAATPPGITTLLSLLLSSSSLHPPPSSIILYDVVTSSCCVVVLYHIMLLHHLTFLCHLLPHNFLLQPRTYTLPLLMAEFILRYLYLHQTGNVAHYNKKEWNIFHVFEYKVI